MADNVDFTPGTGGTASTDQLAGGEHVPHVKIMDGTADSEVVLKVVAEDAVHSSGDTGLVLMAVRKDTAEALAGADGDYIPLIVDSTGRLHIVGAVDVTTLPAGTAVIGGTTDEGPGWNSVFGVSGAGFTSADASTAAAVTDAPTGGQKLIITDLIFSVDTAMQIDFEIETAGTIFFTCHAAANVLYQITPRSKFKMPTAEKKLMVDTDAAGNISVLAFYHSEP